jgi:hypothetical protein
MSTLNFVIGTLVENDSQLLVNNKTPWNFGVLFTEVFLIALGLYLLLSDRTALETTNAFANILPRVGGVVIIVIGIFVASRPHLEELIFDSVQQEMIMIERRWFRLATRKSQFPFSRIVGLNIKAEYRESERLHFFWLDLGDRNYLAIGRTSDERVSEVVNAICSVLNFDESHVNHSGKSEA